MPILLSPLAVRAFRCFFTILNTPESLTDAQGSQISLEGETVVFFKPAPDFIGVNAQVADFSIAQALIAAGIHFGQYPLQPVRFRAQRQKRFADFTGPVTAKRFVTVRQKFHIFSFGFPGAAYGSAKDARSLYSYKKDTLKGAVFS